MNGMRRRIFWICVWVNAGLVGLNVTVALHGGVLQTAIWPSVASALFGVLAIYGMTVVEAWVVGQGAIQAAQQRAVEAIAMVHEGLVTKMREANGLEEMNVVLEETVKH